MLSGMKTWGKIAVVVSAALMLSGCSAKGSTYASPNALHDAYVKAGGPCQDKPEEIPEDMLSEGAHGLLCLEDGVMAMLVVFDDTKAKDRYIARVDTGDYDGEIIAGDRWAIAGDKLPDLSALGGKKVAG